MYNVDQNEEALIARFRQGDRQALRYIHEKYHRTFYNFVYGFVMSQPKTDDALQECFLKLYKARENIKSLLHLERWMFVTLRNYVIDILKQERKERVQSKKYVDLVETGSSLETEFAIAEEDEILKEKAILIVRERINQLPKQQCEVIKQFFFHRRSCDEISLELGVSVQAVRNYKTRGLENLRKSLAGVSWFTPEMLTLTFFIFLLVIKN